MKRNKYLFVCFMLLAITLASGIFTKVYRSMGEDGAKSGQVHVVTSFYPVYIAALNVAGGSPYITLENLSEPQTGCMHDYQLTPQDMILLSKADVFLVNGGGVESFLTEVGQAYPELTISQASRGLALQDEENGHVWMHTGYYAKMVQNIAETLGNADPDHADIYQANADNYCERVQELTDAMETLRDRVAGKTVVIFHEAYEYVAKELEMDNVYCLDLDEERQVSAHEVADVMREILENQISVVFAEELYGKDMGNVVEAETQAEVCYLDTLVRGDYQRDSYLKAVRNNIAALEQAFAKAGLLF